MVIINITGIHGIEFILVHLLVLMKLQFSVRESEFWTTIRIWFFGWFRFYLRLCVLIYLNWEVLGGMLMMIWWWMVLIEGCNHFFLNSFLTTNNVIFRAFLPNKTSNNSVLSGEVFTSSTWFLIQGFNIFVCCAPACWPAALF